MPAPPYYADLPVDGLGRRHCDEVAWNAVIAAFYTWPDHQNANGKNLNNLASIVGAASGGLSATLAFQGPFVAVPALQVNRPGTAANIPTWDRALQIFSPLAKNEETTGGYGFIKIFSNNAASPAEEYLQGNFGIITDPTATNRRLKIECIEQGTGGREITLNEQAGLGGVGGNIGLRGRAHADACVKIESDVANTSYKEMLRLEGLTLGNNWERGIAWWGNIGGLEVARIAAWLNGAERRLRFTVGGLLAMEVRQDGGVKLPSLPSSDPGAGSKQLWYDPGTGVVKFAA